MAKNLTNCNLKEFMVQTRLIKHHVEKWLTDTDIMNIRKNLPDIPDDAESGAVADRVSVRHRRRSTEQIPASTHRTSRGRAGRSGSVRSHRYR